MNKASDNLVYIELKNLQERCQLLQKKLDVTEEENLQLKGQLSSIGRGKSPRSLSDMAILQEELGLLSQEKSVLENQVDLLKHENDDLQSRLMHFMRVNRTLGKRLSTISETLERHDKVLDSRSDTDLNINKNKESLEEISNLLMNTINLEKQQLENHFAEMEELHKDSVQNFPYLHSNQSEVSVTESFAKHMEKLNQFKELLVNQKNKLQNGIINLKQSKSSNLCQSCLAKKNQTDLQNVNEENGNMADEQVNSEPTVTSLSSQTAPQETESRNEFEKICPMCSKQIIGSFIEFQNHVTLHFETDEEGFELLGGEIRKILQVDFKAIFFKPPDTLLRKKLRVFGCALRLGEVLWKFEESIRRDADFTTGMPEGRSKRTLAEAERRRLGEKNIQAQRQQHNLNN